MRAITVIGHIALAAARPIRSFLRHTSVPASKPAHSAWRKSSRQAPRVFCRSIVDRASNARNAHPPSTLDQRSLFPLRLTSPALTLHSLCRSPALGLHPRHSSLHVCSPFVCTHPSQHSRRTSNHLSGMLTQPNGSRRNPRCYAFIRHRLDGLRSVR
jgi:hypothetical protein